MWSSRRERVVATCCPQGRRSRTWLRHNRPEDHLPDFSYRAVSDQGIVEWEYCPVVAAVVAQDDVVLNRDETEGALWIEWRSFVTLADSGAMDLSPWSRLQVSALKEIGAPAVWRDRSDELPDFLR
jgi:isopentenyl-diphosphate Delta-isomerase